MLTLRKQKDDKNKKSNSTSRLIDQMMLFALIGTGIMCIGLNVIVLSMLVRLILRSI